ncbi:hypothetical protein N7520_003912 [Penicillium odoratum]|uniref:uncharacterized protein n=1 Tax=Penicillium odoratum TaxID=1167516 RepID=UPI00254781C5|nr:uncharacterized protein N7520_003912 [Penicillium odoratum]KAJ5769353.1 hypothetical protein N7520_003912 [Penicillium odoratum]
METKKFETAPNCWINTRIWPCPDNNQKPLLVLLHYWGGSSNTWHKLTASNSPTSLSTIYPTMAIDLRGWGESRDQPESLTQDTVRTYSISAMALDVGSILRKMNSDPSTKDLFNYGFVLVGHSMGAKVALATTDSLGDLLHVLKGFVLLAPAPVTPLVLSHEMSEQQQTAYDSEGSIRAVVANLLAEEGKLDASDVELVVRDSLKGHSSAKKAWPAYGMQEDVSALVQGALRQVSVHQPKLRAIVLYGKNDIVEPEARVMEKVVPFLEANNIRVSRLEGVAKVKHLIPLEGPEVVYEQICLEF